jgi:hypothetical protein
MSGIFSLFREVVLINHPEKAKEGHLFWRCVFITFIISSVWLWVSEHQQTLDLQVKLEELTKPKLSADYGEGIGVSPVNSADIVITVSGLIKNQGAPTILENWSIELELPNRVIHGNLLGLPTPKQTIEMEDKDGKPLFFLSGAEHWIRTTRQAAIPTGGGNQGWLNALFRGITPGEVRNKRATIILSCHDVNGKQWVFRDIVGEGAASQEPFIKLEDVLSKPSATPTK